VLTRTGRTERVWPAGGSRGRKRASVELDLDGTAVSLETGVAALGLMLIPWTMFLDSFAVWEVLMLWALWPILLRYCIDRIMKMRAGVLVRVTDTGIEIPGFPRRVAAWSSVRAVDVRRVLFGPDDIVIRSGIVPIVLDTQFTPLSEADTVDWVIAALDDHV
jgi:hypothetical protein